METQKQLIAELKKLSKDAEENQHFVRKDRDKQFYLGRKSAYDIAINLVDSIQVSRSSTEPKIRG